MKLDEEQVRELTQLAPARWTSVRPGDSIEYRCSWRGCPFTMTVRVNQGATVNLSEFPEPLISHIARESHFQITVNEPYFPVSEPPKKRRRWWQLGPV